jgi:FKBP-type peptidyl-prolyl cis-trans isomerase FklB
MNENAFKHVNLSEVSGSHAGSHWSWPPDKLAALLDCPLAHEQGNSMKQHRLAAAVALVSLVLAGCDSQTSVELKTPAQKASYGIGLNMGKSLAQEGMDDLDSKAVAQGIEDAVGKKEQKLKDEELVEAFAALQKRAEERMAKMSEESAAAGKKFLEENAKKAGVVTTASGLQYEVVKKADGAQPKPTDVVTVHYTGKLTNGTVFDSSVERGSPIDLPVSGVIPGWVEGLQLMHVGEKYKLYIPPNWLTAPKAQARRFRPTRCWCSTWNCWASRTQQRKTLHQPSNRRLNNNAPSTGRCCIWCVARVNKANRSA